MSTIVEEMRSRFAAELLEKASKITRVAFDSLGVLFPAKVSLTVSEVEYVRERSHIDGQGISYLRAAGIPVAFITSEKMGFVEAIGNRLNNLPSVQSGAWKPIEIMTGERGKDKVGSLEMWMKENDASLNECAYMGDDLADIKVFEEVGFSAAPAQAEFLTKAHADFVSERVGGDGAIRDLADLILAAKNIDPTTLSRK